MTAIVRSSVIAAVAILTIALCQAQTATARGPQFEVASVKPSPAPPASHAYNLSDTRVELGSVPLKSLIQLAYKLEAHQVSAPDWMATARFDILAKMPTGANRDQIPDMLQDLLADRFGLVVHHEPKEQQVYALLPGKQGSKLAEAAADNTDHTFLTGRAMLYKMETPEADGFWSISVKDGRSTFDAQRITMAELATVLTSRGYFQDPVLDMTGLKGYWQLRFDVPKNTGPFRPMPAANGAPTPPDDPDGISIPASLRKLGLEIQHQKASIDHLVVDSAEKTPTEN